MFEPAVIDLTEDGDDYDYGENGSHFNGSAGAPLSAAATVGVNAGDVQIVSFTADVPANRKRRLLDDPRKLDRDGLYV